MKVKRKICMNTYNRFALFLQKYWKTKNTRIPETTKKGANDDIFISFLRISRSWSVEFGIPYRCKLFFVNTNVVIISVSNL